MRDTRSALARACEQGDEATCERLLREGANINAPAYPFRGVLVSPLMMAVRKKTIGCMRHLLDARADLNTTFGPDLETPLHVCCAQNFAEGTRMLLDNGTLIDPADALGRSPLLLACLSSALECCTLLIEAGAAINKAMTKCNPGATPLYAAALVGAASCADLLCLARASINTWTENGASAMMVACQEGRLETAMILSSHGASREEPRVFGGCLPTNGTWAESLAMRSGHAELVSWLRTLRQPRSLPSTTSKF